MSTSAAKTVAPKKKAAAPKKSAVAAVKLTATQSDLLKKISETGDPGYKSEKKAELRTIDALQKHKLIKRGAKDKASGFYHYLVSTTGKKHLSTSQAGGASTPPPNAP